jgi:sec-independent protein translocase protein TatC
MELPTPATKEPAAPAPVIDLRPSLAEHSATDGEEEGAEMPFLDHLEELRWRIIKALGGVLVTTIACLFFAQWVVDTLLLGPTRPDFVGYRVLGLDAVVLNLQNRTITGQFFAYWGTVLATGLVLGTPFVVWQLWRFVEPALYRHERASLRFVAVYATALFFAGVSFGYLVLTPMALQFFAQFVVSASIVNEFDIARYFELVLTWSFGTGILFELPVVIFVLARLGIATPAVLRKGRKYALIVILVIAALLTPPDPFSQTILALPLLALYELSIVQAAWIERRAKSDERRARSDESL